MKMTTLILGRDFMIQRGKLQLFLLKLLVFLLPMIFISACSPEMKGTLVYVGTYTGSGNEGIYACRFDTLTGNLELSGLVAEIANPSFLAIDSAREFMYCVNETDSFQNEKTGAVSVFSIEKESGYLKLLQEVSSMGAGPCHISLDQLGRYILVANYGGGNFAIYPVEKDGRLGEVSAFVQNKGSSVNTKRQEGPHAHFIQATHNNRFVMVCDLGTDEVLVYRFKTENGSLTPVVSGFINMQPGSGPRHLSVSPCGKFVFVLNELTSTIAVFSFDEETGMAIPKQTISSLPTTYSGMNWSAEITTDAMGRFLYVSNRGHNSIAIFAIHPEGGTLTPVEWVSCGGNAPRHFAIDPSGKWLICANQNSNNIVVFGINKETGLLIQTKYSLELNAPVCVQFLN